jgi:hypothetical protein
MNILLQGTCILDLYLKEGGQNKKKGQLQKCNTQSYYVGGLSAEERNF